MFVLCPHCQFLVTVDPRTGRAPTACPKCGGALGTQDELQDVPASIAAEHELPPPMAASDWSAPSPMLPPLAEHDALSDAIANIVGHDEASASAQLRADAVIAAMVAKPARRSRAAKPLDEAAKAVKRPRRTKASTPAAEVAPPPADTSTPEAPAKPARKPLLARIGSLFASKQPAPTPEPEKKPEPKAKASVKPIPSLRERAAKRAAAAAEAAAATTAPVVEEATPAMSVEPAPTVAPEPIVEVVAEPIVEVAPEPLVEIAPTPIVEVAPEPIVEVAPIVEPEPVVERAPPPPPVVARPRATPQAPSFLRKRAQSALSLPARWSHIATISLLSLVLALQLLLAQRDVLGADARWRSVVSGACGVLRCSVPAWRQPEAFTMLSRDVRPHPRAPGTLQIDASFRNDARWAQAWPRLVVSLSDIDGRVVGTRAFTAREYLGAAPTQNLLASGQTAAIHLDVVEPAPGIVAFSFDFR